MSGFWDRVDGIDWSLVAIGSGGLLFVLIVALLSQTDEPPCYKSTMGNPDQVVMIHNVPYACTNAIHGYRCLKMEPCR